MSVFDPLAICLVIFASTITIPKRSNIVNVTESEPKPPTNQITNNNENTIPSKVSTKQPSTAKSTKVTKQVTDDTIEVQTITSDTVENSIPPKVQSSIQKAVDLYYKTRSRDKRNLPHQMRK